jgi:hypothetical protein
VIAVDIGLFLIIALLCWRGYQQRQLWMFYLGRLLERMFNGRSFLRVLFSLGPMLVGWLLLCHWINTHGWHGLAAGGVLLAMTLGLNAMRNLEEKQKWEKEQCDILK